MYLDMVINSTQNTITENKQQNIPNKFISLKQKKVILGMKKNLLSILLK